jgi:hypothetical protein
MMLLQPGQDASHRQQRPGNQGGISGQDAGRKVHTMQPILTVNECRTGCCHPAGCRVALQERQVANRNRL